MIHCLIDAGRSLVQGFVKDQYINPRLPDEVIFIHFGFTEEESMFREVA